MRIFTIFSVALIVHINWVCGDAGTVLPQSTEKNTFAETTTQIQVKLNDGNKITSITPSMAMNNLLKYEQKEQEQESAEEQSSNESGSFESSSEEDYPLQSIPPYTGTYRKIRSVPNLHDKLPVQVRTFTSNSDLSGCSCFCPPSRPCSGAAPIYIPPPPPPVYFGSSPYFVPPPPPAYLAPPQVPSPQSHPSYVPPPAYGRNAFYPEYEYAFARNAPDNDDDELKDSITQEARIRSSYADQPVYPAPAPAPAQYAPSPAPSANCGQNLLVGCAPTVTNVPCSASY